jgi:hypothetical protein
MGVFNGKSKIMKGKSLPVKYPVDITKRLLRLEKDQSEIINIDVGGTIYQISKDTIDQSKYEHNYFKILIHNKEEIYFLDRSTDTFEIILQILRYSTIIKLLKPNEEYPIIRSISKNIVDKDIFREDLKFYFNKDFDDVIKDFDLSTVLEMKDCNYMIESYELIKQNTDEKLEYMFYNAKDIKELYNEYCQKGFFFENGGGIIIKLSYVTPLSRIEIKPFLLDEAYWREEDCPFVNVYSLANGSDRWIRIGSINLNFRDETGVSRVYLVESHTKAIKLSTEENMFPFSISYIKLY